MNVIEARDVWKIFDATVALRGAHLRVEKGSIHALVGENGAGKSTLIKILTGVHHADRGVLRMDGVERVFSSPQEAIDAGIGTVYQERNLVPEFSLSENLFLHAPPTRAGFVQYERMHREARGWLERVGLFIDPRTPAGLLSAAQRQLVEIARALALEARVLFLDEPTASITEREASVLFGILRELRDRGSAILFVSHKLEEVFALCDRITVIRDGETIIGAGTRTELTQDDVITAMVGRSITQSAYRDSGRDEHKPPLLEIKGLATRFGHRNVGLAVRPGQVAGLYGLVGAGRTELARAILGLDRIEGGEIQIRGGRAEIANPHVALSRYRIGYMSEDRKGEGLILPHSISHNVGVTIWDRLKATLGYITPERERRKVGSIVERLGVRLRSLDQAVGQLSGGNQQKVSVAKWLAADVDILIIDEPTIGVDVRTKEDMYHLIEELARMGKAVLMISSDLAEIVRLSDIIHVMANKRLIAELPNSGDYALISGQVMKVIVSSQSRVISEPLRTAS